MKETKQGFDTERDILMQIFEGTKVYDRDEREIGEVDDVFLGSPEVQRTTLSEQPAVPVMNPNLESRPYIPGFVVAHSGGEVEASTTQNATVINRLRREGYIHIDTGWLHQNRVALVDQIERVDGRKLVLKVSREQLLPDDVLMPGN